MDRLLVPKTINNKTNNIWTKVRPAEWDIFDDVFLNWQYAELKQLADFMDQQIRDSLKK